MDKITSSKKKELIKKNTNPKKKTEYKVEMVIPDSGGITRTYIQIIQAFTRFGKELKITPKANVSINQPGYKSEYFVETVSVLIGIGKDHTADLVMTKEAWEALKKGAVVDIETTEKFKEKYL